MTALEMMVWSGIALVAGIAAAHIRQVVPQVGSLTMYRRSGGPIVMPRRSVGPTATSARQPLFDGVIVPSARGAASLLRAAQTAKNAGATLVIFASGLTEATEARLLLGTDGCIVLETPPAISEPHFRTFHHPCAATTTDISRKRNAGLVLARLRGWQTVLFVDDDVQTIEQQDLMHASGLLAGADRGRVPRRIVGWAFDEFSDFSVVGHASRQGTAAKVPYIGGGAMAVRCNLRAPFFPPVYNEDLLVCLTALTEDPTSVCLAGTLDQDTYAPFADHTRATAQEFGEVLAEGYGRRPEPAELRKPSFWAAVLRDRHTLVSEAAVNLQMRGEVEGTRAMRAVLAAHSLDWPELLAGFAADWEHDRSVWQKHLMSLSAFQERRRESPAG